MFPTYQVKNFPAHVCVSTLLLQWFPTRMWFILRLTDLDPNTEYDIQTRVIQTDDGTTFNETESDFGSIVSVTTG